MWNFTEFNQFIKLAKEYFNCEAEQDAKKQYQIVKDYIDSLEPKELLEEVLIAFGDNQEDANITPVLQKMMDTLVELNLTMNVRGIEIKGQRLITLLANKVEFTSEIIECRRDYPQSWKNILIKQGLYFEQKKENRNQNTFFAKDTHRANSIYVSSTTQSHPKNADRQRKRVTMFKIIPNCPPTDSIAPEFK